MWKTASLRRTHRRLGVFVGIQLLFWIGSGIYFAWTNIDEIHGDHLRNPTPIIEFGPGWVSPSVALAELGPEFDMLAGLAVVSFADSTFYQLRSRGAEARTALVNVESGRVHGSLTQAEATELVRATFAPDSDLREMRLLRAADVGPHHEYRGGDLPAWVASFEHRSGVRVYVSAEGGEVTKFRTRDWRVFDFLWMMHTMDYLGRDDFNNPLLRSVSLLALLLTVTGYWMWKRTRPKGRARRSEM